MNRIPHSPARRHAIRGPYATPVFLLIALLSGHPVGAEPAAPPRWFATELEAVIDAAGRYNPQSIAEDREFMGAILRRRNCYIFTVGAGEPGRDRITVGFTVPPDAEIIAFWHTHGARRDSNRYFSNVDTELVETWRKRFYLADHTGLLKVIAPGVRKLSKLRARKLGLPPVAGYARGTVVSDASGRPVKIAT